jgi:D-amino-acid dehydrogenase
MSRVLIVGAGIIGLSTGYELIRKGYRVEIMDREKPGTGCSYGNAGMIVPSHFNTLPSPGIVAQALRWMTRSTSPFSLNVSLNRLSLDFLWKFYLYASHTHVEKHRELLAGMHLHSRQIYLEWEKELQTFKVDTSGITMLFKSAKGEKEEITLAGKASDLGIPAIHLSRMELEEKEPATRFNVRGGVHYPLDAHLNPGKLMKSLREELVRRGAMFYDQTGMTGIAVSKGQVTGIQTTAGLLPGDYFVIATGAWSQAAGRSLGVHLPVLSGKGYSFSVEDRNHTFRIPKLINEERVTITPLGSHIRFGGTMQLGDSTTLICQNRIRGILHALSRYFPDFPLPEIRELKPWFGFRPVSPDGLPYLGKLSRHPNVIIATGHAMTGISLAASTGRLVSEIISGKEPELSIDDLGPERFNK